MKKSYFRSFFVRESKVTKSKNIQYAQKYDANNVKTIEYVSGHIKTY